MACPNPSSACWHMPHWLLPAGLCADPPIRESSQDIWIVHVDYPCAKGDVNYVGAGLELPGWIAQAASRAMCMCRLCSHPWDLSWDLSGIYLGFIDTCYWRFSRLIDPVSPAWVSQDILGFEVYLIDMVLIDSPSRENRFLLENIVAISSI